MTQEQAIKRCEVLNFTDRRFGYVWKPRRLLSGKWEVRQEKGSLS